MEPYVERHRAALQKRARALGYQRANSPAVVVDVCLRKLGETRASYTRKHRASLVRLAKSKGLKSPRSLRVVAESCVRRVSRGGGARRGKQSPVRRRRPQRKSGRRPQRQSPVRKRQAQRRRSQPPQRRKAQKAKRRSQPPKRGKAKAKRRSQAQRRRRSTRSGTFVRGTGSRRRRALPHVRAGAPQPVTIEGVRYDFRGESFAYQKRQFLGEGADGKVWMCHAKALVDGYPDLVVGVKFAKGAEGRENLAHEWFIGRKLGVWPECHSMFPCMLELGPTWFSREYVEGTVADKIFAKWAAEGSNVVEETRYFLGGIARTLRTAHEQGVIHFDTHLGNVLVRPDRTVVLIDFGRSCSLAPEDPFDVRCRGRPDIHRARDVKYVLAQVANRLRDLGVRIPTLPPDVQQALRATTTEEIMGALAAQYVPTRDAAYAFHPHQIEEMPQ